MKNIDVLPFKEQLEDKWKILFYFSLFAVMVIVPFLLNLKLSLKEGFIIGGVCGVIGHFRACRIFEWKFLKKDIPMQSVELYLQSLMYFKSYRNDTYVPNLPHWARFNSQNIIIYEKGEVNILRGPGNIVKKIVKNFA